MKPSVAVVIGTRNRGASVVGAVRTVLDNDHPTFELIVVDQSDDDGTEAALGALGRDPRLTVVRSREAGIARARNLGIAATRAEIVALTDDDCEVPSTWISRMTEAFSAGDRVAVVFGNVLPGPFDRGAGFIPSYSRPKPFLARSILDKPKVEGIGACMGVRRSAWEALGGFDERFGSGAPFRSADDTEFTARALMAGYHVYETPEVWLTHHGFRTWEDGRPLVQGYMHGIGAMLGKHLARGRAGALWVAGALAWRWAFGRPVVDLGLTPPRLMRLVAFGRGMAHGVVRSKQPT